MILLIAFQSIGHAQTDRFMHDISAMKISLNFKDFVVADSNTNPGRISHGTTSHKVFVNHDSSQLILLLISHRPKFVRNLPERSEPEPDRYIVQSPVVRSKESIRMGKKFGAKQVYAPDELISKPSTRFSGYTEVWAAVAFGETGYFGIIIHQKENSRTRRGKKALENYASNFIKFNE